MNTMTINNHHAVIAYDEEIDMFRGEFVGLNGGADFYAADIATLRKEGETSLQLFLQSCKERGIDPYKHYSGKFNLRIPPDLHAKLAAQATAHGKSINGWIVDILQGKAPEYA